MRDLDDEKLDLAGLAAAYDGTHPDLTRDDGSCCPTCHTIIEWREDAEKVGVCDSCAQDIIPILLRRIALSAQGLTDACNEAAALRASLEDANTIITMRSEACARLTRERQDINAALVRAQAAEGVIEAVRGWVQLERDVGMTSSVLIDALAAYDKRRSGGG